MPLHFWDSSEIIAYLTWKRELLDRLDRPKEELAVTHELLRAIADADKPTQRELLVTTLFERPTSSHMRGGVRKRSSSTTARSRLARTLKPKARRVRRT